MQQVKAPRGRPSKGEEAKRHPLGIRTTKDLKDKIEAAADQTGRSVAQEIERRLEQSFELDEALGPENMRFFHAVKTHLDLIEKVKGESWMESYGAWHAVAGLLPDVLNEFRPIPPNAAEIVAAMDAERLSKEAYDTEQAKLRQLLTGTEYPRLGKLLLDAIMRDEREPADTELLRARRSDGTERTEEERAAIVEQENRTARARDAWLEAEAHAAQAWSEADRQQAAGTKLARKIIDLRKRYVPPYAKG